MKHSYNFIREYFYKHGYILLSKKYISRKSLKIKCPKGHITNMRFDVFQKGSRCKFCYYEKQNGKTHSSWKGGYDRNIPLYDTYAEQIIYAEIVRRNQEDKNILEVKCTYCGKWHVPNVRNIWNRIYSLNGKSTGEHRLYCSNECKIECPIYNTSKYPKGYKKASSREVQSELRQLVFERDNWECKKCKNKKSLHCHHVEGIRWEPLESADIDKCITYCKDCHKEVHQKEECKTSDMRCK